MRATHHFKLLLIAVAVVVCAALAFFAAPAEAGRGNVKVQICHVPPGNPDNAHTIVVGEPAVPAHLAHGDYLGECDGGGPIS
jgi:hypothetical protein